MFRPVFQDFTSVSDCQAISRLETRDLASAFGGQAVKLTGRQADRQTGKQVDRSRKMNQAVQDQFLTERKKRRKRERKRIFIQRHEQKDGGLASDEGVAERFLARGTGPGRSPFMAQAGQAGRQC